MSIKRFIQGNGGQIKNRLKAKREVLSNSDLNYVDGSEEELLRRLQVKLEIGNKELITKLKKIIAEVN